MARKAVAGKRWGDYGERVARVTTVRGGIGEDRNDFHELIDRPGPPVNEKQRLGIGAASFFVDEVEVETCNLGPKMTQAVQVLFVLAPVVPRPPVLDQFAQVSKVGAVFPGGIGYFVR